MISGVKYEYWLVDMSMISGVKYEYWLMHD